MRTLILALVSIGILSAQSARRSPAATPIIEEPRPLSPPGDRKAGGSSEAQGPPDAAPNNRGTTRSAGSGGQSLRGSSEDLTGIWTNATITPLERPAGAKATLTDAEAKVYEKKASEELNKLDGASEGPLLAATGSNGTGGYNVLFVDRGNEFARVDGQKRTSLIMDPPDGHVPPIKPEARQRNAAQNRIQQGGVRDRPLAERCLVGFGSTSGPPMLPVLYNNNYQIVQTPDSVMILVEMVHDARIIRINGTHAAPNVRQYLGDSIGHWEGKTLVVDTTNFNDKIRFRGASENLHVIERFTRTAPDTILYKATLDDPTTWEKPWTVEYPFVATPGPIYEYACHEGNYSITDILGAKP